MTFGEKLLKLRKERGFSQEELASRIIVSRQAISRWEMGGALPDTENILQLSHLFGVSTDYLINDDFESDMDIPAVKNKEDTMTKENNRLIGFIIGIGTLAIFLFLGLIGWIVWRSILIVFLSLITHIINIIVFETIYHKYKDEHNAADYRRKYYRIAVWFVAYFPVRIVMITILNFVNMGIDSAVAEMLKLVDVGIGSVVAEMVILLIYLFFCGVVTFLLRKKRKSLE